MRDGATAALATSCRFDRMMGMQAATAHAINGGSTSIIRCTTGVDDDEEGDDDANRDD